MKSDSVPVLCLNRDKEVIKSCINCVLMLEPCSILEINGFGVKIIYFALVEELKKISKGRLFIHLNAQTKDELKHFLDFVEKEKEPITCLINISINEDSSWFIRELDDIRDRRNTDFVTVILTRVGEVYQSLIDKQKLLFRSMNTLEPLDYKDFILLIKDFDRRFSFTPKKQQLSNIYDLSGGHVGLIKSLYLQLKANPDMKFGEDELIKLPSIVCRLEEIVKLFPQDLLEDLYNYPRTTKYNEFFERYHFVKNGKVFSPLLHKYLEKNIINPTVTQNVRDKLKLDLSKGESEIFDLLLDKNGTIVSREDVAKVVWKKEVEEKYSDWAIDQVIYRLRSKLKSHNIPHNILTKKGQGFVLQKK